MNLKTFACLFVFWAAACAPSATDDAGTSLIVDAGPCALAEPQRGVTVVVTGNGDRVCNATITASDGEFQEVLVAFGTGAQCEYFGLFDRAGSYEILVRAPNFANGNTTASVSLDDCGNAITEQIEVSLTPGVPNNPDAGVQSPDVDENGLDVEVLDVVIDAGVGVADVSANNPDVDNNPDAPVNNPDVDNNNPDVPVNNPDVSLPDVENNPDVPVNNPDVSLPDVTNSDVNQSDA